MKVRAVEIWTVAARPVDVSAIHAIERLEALGRRRPIEEQPEIAGGHAALTRRRALLPRGDAFDRPHRLIEVGEQQGHPAESAPQAADPAAGATEVRDVRVLVNEHQPQPVRRVADAALSRRRSRADLDGVVRKRRRPAVRQIVLVDEDDLDPPDRCADRPVDLGRGGLDERRQPPRERFLALMEMDVEPPRGDGAEAQARIVARRRSCGDREHRSHAAMIIAAAARALIAPPPRYAARCAGGRSLAGLPLRDRRAATTPAAA